MKPESINTFFWMVVFAAVTFCLIPIVWLIFVLSQVRSDAWIVYVIWPIRLIFLASPWVALVLGRRGALPGTKPTAGTNRKSNPISKILTGSVILIGLLFALGAWIAFLPQPGRPNISITFLGHTNNDTGTELDSIAVTNLNLTTIFVYQPRVQIQAQTDPRSYEDYFSGSNCPWAATLVPGASDSFTIPPPTNHLPWRLSFYVYPDRGNSLKNRLKHVVAITCLSVGLWPLFASSLPINGAFRHPYNIEGDWIKHQK